METIKRLSYPEWIALRLLYQHRVRSSSPLRYIGLPATITALLQRQAALVQWIGKAADQQVHITPAGITVFEAAGDK